MNLALPADAKGVTRIESLGVENYRALRSVGENYEHC